MVPSAPDLEKKLLSSGSPLIASTSMSQSTIDYMRQMAGYDAVGHSPFRRASFVACAMASGYSPDVEDQARARAELRSRSPRSASSPSIGSLHEPQQPSGKPKAGAPVRRQVPRPPSPPQHVAASPLLAPKLFVTPEGQPCDLLHVSPRAGSLLLSATDKNRSPRLLAFSPTRSPQPSPDCAPQQQPEKPQTQPQPQQCLLQDFVSGKERLPLPIRELFGTLNESGGLVTSHLSWAQMSLSRAQPLACSTAVAEMLRKVPPDSPVRGVVDDAVFGVEIEAFLPKFPDEADDNTCDKANTYICPFLNRVLAPTDIVFKYHMLQNARVDHNYECWKVTTDGSIAALTKADGGSNGIFGFEIVSAKLRGWRGLGEVACVAKALTQMVARTNASTGLHVHVSCKAYTDKQLQNLGAFLLYYESVIDTFHPHARRKDNSAYSRSLSYSVSMCAMRLERMGTEEHGPLLSLPLPPSTAKVTLASPTTDETDSSGRHTDDGAVKRADAVRQLLTVDVGFPAGFSRLLSMLNPRTGVKVASGRYHKANFTNLRATSVGDECRRVEYRQHEGTCDVNDIVMWVRFLIFFTQSAALSKPPDPSVPPTFDTLFDSLVPDAEVRSFYKRRVAEHSDDEPDTQYSLRTYCM